MLAPRRFWSFVALILLAALLARLPGISTRSLWIDELYSQWFASQSFADLWQQVPYFETHPPIYYMLLKLWTLLFGTSELGLRSLSLLASLLTVGTVALTGRLTRLGKGAEWAGLAGALLLTVNFANIRDAQNVRPYALHTLITTLAISAAILLMIRLSRQRSEGILDWKLPALVLGVSAGSLLWLHNISLFICFGLWLGLFSSLLFTPAEQRLRNVLIFTGTSILALLVWAPYVPIFIGQLNAFMGLAFWLEPKPRDLYSAWFLLLGQQWWALAIAFCLLAAGLWQIWRRAPALALFAAILLIVPLYLVLAVHFAIKPVYIQRLFAWQVPLALTVIAAGALAFIRPKWISGLLLAALLVLSVWRTYTDFNRPIDDWKMISETIAANAQPDDVVIAIPAEGSVAVDYYARRQATFPPIVYVPGPYPQRHLPRTYMSNLGAPRIIPEDAQIVEEALKTHKRVWLVQVSVQLYDPKNIIRSKISSQRTFVRYYGNALARVDLFE